MRFFRSEVILREWQAIENNRAGETLAPRQVWELSKLWYQDRLSPDYHGRTTEQIAAIFRQVGLTSKFWYPDV